MLAEIRASFVLVQFFSYKERFSLFLTLLYNRRVRHAAAAAE